MTKRLHGTLPEPDESCTVLAVNLDHADTVSVTRLLGGSSWTLQEARTCREAVARSRNTPVAVVLCTPQMPDGDWRSLLNRLHELPDAPAVIVASRLMEEHLWVEVLNRGGYDVLLLPFDRSELLRVLFLAWRTFKRESEDECAPMKSPASGSGAMPTTSRFHSQAVA